MVQLSLKDLSHNYTRGYGMGFISYLYLILLISGQPFENIRSYYRLKKFWDVNAPLGRRQDLPPPRNWLLKLGAWARAAPLLICSLVEQHREPCMLITYETLLRTFYLGCMNKRNRRYNSIWQFKKCKLANLRVQKA